MPTPAFHVFHLTFIGEKRQCICEDCKRLTCCSACTQNFILYGLGYPAYVALRNPNTPLGPIDAVLTGLVLLDLLVEFVADNQQYSFQTFKHSKPPRVQKAPSEEWFFAKQRWTEEDAKTGFVNKGLWAWSRHPNFAAEQAFWVSALSVSLSLSVDVMLSVAYGSVPSPHQIRKLGSSFHGDDSFKVHVYIYHSIFYRLFLSGAYLARHCDLDALLGFDNIHGMDHETKVSCNVRGLSEACGDVLPNRYHPQRMVPPSNWGEGCCRKVDLGAKGKNGTWTADWTSG